MNFNEAMQALKDGKKVRRFWFVGDITGEKHYRIISRSADENIKFEDLRAEDWEIVE